MLPTKRNDLATDQPDDRARPYDRARAAAAAPAGPALLGAAEMVPLGWNQSGIDVVRDLIPRSLMAHAASPAAAAPRTR
jgi:ribosomal protein S12 methylthiotransferase accessory factor YcaO